MTDEQGKKNALHPAHDPNHPSNTNDPTNEANKKTEQPTANPQPKSVTDDQNTESV